MTQYRQGTGDKYGPMYKIGCQTQDNSIFRLTKGVTISGEMNIFNISALV